MALTGRPPKPIDSTAFDYRCRWHGCCCLFFDTVEDAREHEFEDHIACQTTLFICRMNNCRKRYKSRTSLARHYLCHGQRNFPCNICPGLSFSREDKLINQPVDLPEASGSRKTTGDTNGVQVVEIEAVKKAVETETVIESTGGRFC